MHPLAPWPLDHMPSGVFQQVCDQVANGTALVGGALNQALMQVPRERGGHPLRTTAHQLGRGHRFCYALVASECLKGHRSGLHQAGAFPAPLSAPSGLVFGGVATPQNPSFPMAAETHSVLDVAEPRHGAGSVAAPRAHICVGVVWPGIGLW
jgi:hypothetical protein